MPLGMTLHGWHAATEQVSKLFSSASGHNIKWHGSTNMPLRGDALAMYLEGASRAASMNATGVEYLDCCPQGRSSAAPSAVGTEATAGRGSDLYGSFQPETRDVALQHLPAGLSKQMCRSQPCAPSQPFGVAVVTNLRTPGNFSEAGTCVEDYQSLPCGRWMRRSCEFLGALAATCIGCICASCSQSRPPSHAQPLDGHMCASQLLGNSASSLMASCV